MSDISNTSKSSKDDSNRPIQILPPQLANQIAAGEVVERPASVVKELVENSIDAGATQIQIDIEQGGQKRILVRDDGKGISKEQLTLALSRHATSKISTIDDLEHITSMGFRGEALASISSVSRLTLTSKPAAQTEAWQAKAEGLQMEVELKPAAHPNGSSIEVVDLFFNTPARRKFLRTGKTEFQHIEQIIKRIALTRPDIQFILSHNQKVCCRFNAVGELSKRIEQVCGKNMLLNCEPIFYEYEDISLTGWCSKLGFGNANRDLQYTFVNGRMMKDKLLSHALRQVYEDTLGPQSFPCYVLYIELPPQQIDVNVHPAKHEVRFHQARQIHDLVFKAVSDNLGQAANSEYINEAAKRPQHGYIQPLTALSSGQKQTSYTGASGYRANTPSKSEINASHDFYASLNEQSDIEAQTQPSDTSNKKTSFITQTEQGVGHCIYCAPHLIFAENGCIRVIDIVILMTKLVKLRLRRSTLEQPLLMPVSVENIGHFTQRDLDAFKQMRMDITVSHKKLILKQVPSELRQLPWAVIFAGIDVSDLIKKSVDVDTLADSIAKTWLSSIDINDSMLTGWMQEIGKTGLSELINEHAKSLQLAQWMQNE